MNNERAEKVFPNFFSNLKLPEGAKLENINVYRLCIWGKIDREAFYGTYEVQIKGLTSNKSFNSNSDDPGDYSTSCYEKEKDIKRRKKTFSRHHPEVKVAYGITESSCGPCQRTKEREPNKKDSHVDWWIYENSNPQDYFKEVEL
ncbi:hypothetical protein JMF89_04055 [Clostridiaceae bacterium UIB06]|uniref:Uncharacterized protein n=1 Tax=Clostridium thailandense TaxID=2794346 RepID=A0A949TSR6_9CLOT|nr:hypothetical protein [Clostridium thailandense]MBV7271643.1 hypothetical protein [Clostridium thailandense]MCH5136387.1 hypothetical protein [Clostridiaceae bacterium UIB06]